MESLLKNTPKLQDYKKRKQHQRICQHPTEHRKTALHALTARGKNATLPNVNQEKLKAVMRGLETGELRHPRFTQEEFAASKGTQHEQLWNYILLLESSDMDGSGAEALDRGKGKTHPQGGGRLGRLRRVATRYESDPGEVASGLLSMQRRNGPQRTRSVFASRRKRKRPSENWTQTNLARDTGSA